jgi:hypothetical protein
MDGFLTFLAFTVAAVGICLLWMFIKAVRDLDE